MLIICTLSVAVSTTAYARERYLSQYLGDAELISVTIKIDERGHGFTYINLHESEQTSVRAGLQALTLYGGRMLALNHGGKRNISFTLDGRKYEFDPNRMFTDAGVRATLIAQSSYSEHAHSVVKGFAQTFLEYTALRGMRGGLIVALHNNTNGGYSINSYKPNGGESRATKELFINPNNDPDNFFLVTEQAMYNALVTRGYNVVLQDPRTVPDDGSLSVYAAQNGIAYVNVETQHSNAQMYKQMLQVLNEL